MLGFKVCFLHIMIVNILDDLAYIIYYNLSMHKIGRGCGALSEQNLIKIVCDRKVQP